MSQLIIRATKQKSIFKKSWKFRKDSTNELVKFMWILNLQTSVREKMERILLSLILGTLVSRQLDCRVKRERHFLWPGLFKPLAIPIPHGKMIWSQSVTSLWYEFFFLTLK